jgi:hypothetical protein
MNLNKLNDLDLIKCPLTDLIYYDPVVAEDGYIYEYMAIKYWFEKDITSPVTSVPIGKKLVRAKQYKTIIDHYLSVYPEQTVNQFINKKPYYLFKEEFINLLTQHNFNDLIIYTDILLTDYLDDRSIGGYLFTECQDNEIIKTIINNSVDYDTYDDEGNKLIHFATKYSNQEIIKHLIDKKIDINCIDMHGNRPVHYIFEYQENIDLIANYFIDNNKELFFNNKGMLPIHIVCKNLNVWSKIEWFLKTNSNNYLELTSRENLKPLHYVCKYAKNLDVIKKFICLDVCLDNDNDNILTEQLLYTNTNLDNKEKQEAVHFYLTKLFQKPTIVDYF